MAIASERFIMLLNLFKVASDLNQGEGDLTRRPSQILACLMVKDNFYKSVINFQNLSCPLKCIPLGYELISSSIGRIRWSTQLVHVRGGLDHLHMKQGFFLFLMRNLDG